MGSPITQVVLLSIRNHWTAALLLAIGLVYADSIPTGYSPDLTHFWILRALTAFTALLVFEKLYLTVFNIKRAVVPNPIVHLAVRNHWLILAPVVGLAFLCSEYPLSSVPQALGRNGRKYLDYFILAESVFLTFCKMYMFVRVETLKGQAKVPLTRNDNEKNK
ncbi:hypothetical protein AKO1_005434 [Acrasis kona]|uniref:Uncharacterized protein n=1 Tax=Acrasis kona TaxID=1008807 RepID=A0AAW2ZJ42_9EUKA